MSMMKRMIFVLAALAALAGCEPETVKTVLIPSGEEVEYAEIPVTLDVVAGDPQTKAPMLSGADDARRGGVLFLVYRSATKRLDSFRFFTPEELTTAASQALTIRAPLADCDIYVLGNLLATAMRLMNFSEMPCDAAISLMVRGPFAPDTARSSSTRSA